MGHEKITIDGHNKQKVATDVVCVCVCCCEGDVEVKLIYAKSGSWTRTAILEGSSCQLTATILGMIRDGQG